MPMLNLAYIFEDAIAALREYRSLLTVPPLPTAVFLMQRDVINHYRYALTHYFCLPLDAPCLQDSSLGSPYEKWARFTSEDFELVSLAVHNLLRYSCRLINETAVAGLKRDRHFTEAKVRGNVYINSLSDIKSKGESIGIRIEPGNVLVTTPWAPGPSFEGRIVGRSTDGESTTYEHTTTGTDGQERTTAMTRAEYLQLTQTLREVRGDITDRIVLATLRDRGLAEVDSLAGLNTAFGELCNQYYSTVQPATPFDGRHQPWCV
jgi:hypothetical protein